MKSFRAATLIAFAALCGVVLPLSLLHAAEAFLKYDHLFELSSLGLLLAALYLLLSLLTGLGAACLELVCGQFGADRRVAHGRIVHAIALAAGGFVLLTLLVFMRFWIDEVWPGSFGGSIGSLRWVVLAAVLCAVLLLAARSSAARVTEWVLGASRPLAGLALILILAMVVSAVVGRLAFESGDVTPAPAAVAANDSSQRPHIFLISADALSAYDMSLYGYRLPTTPNLDAFARHALVFERFYANSNLTTPAVASLMTGARPWTHGVQQFQAFLRPPFTRVNLPATLRAAGYYTAAFTQNPYANPRQLRIDDAFAFNAVDALGYPSNQVTAALAVSQNLDVQNLAHFYPISYALDLYHVWALARRNDPALHSPDRVFDAARSLLATMGRSGQPLFVWTHVWQPHHYYLAPKPFLHRYLPAGQFDTFAAQSRIPRWYGPRGRADAAALRLRYDETIAAVDDAIGGYLQFIDDHGLLQNSIVIVTSDHGESFGHGQIGHGGPRLDESLIRIPLLVRLPGGTTSGRIGVPGEQVDLMPTLLRLLRITVPAGMEGRDLLERSSDAPIFSMNLETDSSFAALRRGTIAMVHGDAKLVYRLDRAGSDALFDVNQDAGELTDLAALRPDVAARMADEIHSQVALRNEARRYNSSTARQERR